MYTVYTVLQMLISSESSHQAGSLMTSGDATQEPHITSHCNQYNRQSMVNLVGDYKLIHGHFIKAH